MALNIQPSQYIAAKHWNAVNPERQTSRTAFSTDSQLRPRIVGSSGSNLHVHPDKSKTLQNSSRGHREQHVLRERLLRSLSEV